jgi:N-glycosylase/DNA lyase
LAFSNWQIWEDAPHFTAASFVETIDGGQAFRWKRLDASQTEAGPDGRSPAPAITYEGQWSRNIVRLRLNEETLEFSVVDSADPAKALREIKNYLAVDTDFRALTDALPWRSDPVLRAAIDAYPGLRILRQPLDETLFCFLCSSTKQIPQIKAICEAVASSIGDPLALGSHALPSWAQIAEAGESQLRAAKLGYRARFIHQTSVFLAEQPDYLNRIKSAPTSQARELLMQLPGVGRKIADCTLLFGAGRLEAFPIDTWVQKILADAYGLTHWKPEQYLDFARIHFGPAAGLAQQYLFAAARAGIIIQRGKRDLT